MAATSSHMSHMIATAAGVVGMEKFRALDEVAGVGGTSIVSGDCRGTVADALVELVEGGSSSRLILKSPAGLGDLRMAAVEAGGLREARREE